MRVVVTGATGFLGGAVARALAADGAEVVALARSSSDRTALNGVVARWHVGDVRRPESLQGLFDGAEAVVHAAGMLGQAGIPESAYYRLHVDGTRHVLAAAAAASPAPRVVYVSSPGVLGPIEGAPAAEDAPLAPSNPYERSKAAAELVARQAANAGQDIVIARPEFVYGPGDHHVLGLFRAVQKRQFFYIGDGGNSCHPTYVADAVDGILRCLKQGQPGEIYHIAGPRPVTFRELAEWIAAALDVPAPRLAVPVAAAGAGAALLEGMSALIRRQPPLSRNAVAFFSEDRRFSWAKAHRELDYTPQTDVAEGVARTVAWYRREGLLA